MDLQIDSLILDLAPVIVLNRNSIIEKWNQGLTQIYGWSQVDALGKNAHQLLNTVFPEPLDDIERQILEKGEWRGELIHTKKDGSPILVYSRWILEHNKNGKNRTILEFVSDITQYESYKDALGESFFKRLMDDSPQAIFLATLEGKPILFNAAFARMFNYQSPEECINLIHNSADFLSDPVRQEEIIRVIQGSFERATFENLYRRKDGSTFWGNLDVRQAENRVGLVPYYEGFIENITDWKRAEEKLRESRERLAHLSRRLVETQEKERRRIARELHDEIGQTLTALTITLDGIQQTVLDPTLNQKLTNLQNLAHELINQVNALSSDLRPRVLDDLGLIPGLISLINRLTTQTGIEFDFKHGPLDQKQIPPEIEITAYRIIQEALTNVIRHANVKEAVVRIQIDEDTLWIQIQDDGKGFDYPTAVHSVNSMGLINMLERAELVGGLVTIQTAPAEGTNITCLLPLGEGFIERRKNARD